MSKMLAKERSLEQIFKNASEKSKEIKAQKIKKNKEVQIKFFKKLYNLTKKFLGEDFLTKVKVEYSWTGEPLSYYESIGKIKITSPDDCFTAVFDLKGEYYSKKFKFLGIKYYLVWYYSVGSGISIKIDSTKLGAKEEFLEIFQKEWNKEKHT